MSDIAKGEVTFNVAGTDYVLKPTLDAFRLISHKYTDYTDLVRAIARNDTGAMAFVMRQGLGYNDAQAKKLPSIIMQAGVSALIEPLTDFVFRLFNAGKSPEEVMKEQNAKAEAAEGKTEGVAEDKDPLLGA